MLTPQDDFIGHQQPTSFAHTVTSDPAWMERLWYAAHPVPGGDVILNIGIGFHPNRNVMDGHAGISVGGKQYTVRFSRHLGRNPLDIEIGPLKIQVLEGLKRHRLTLAPNDLGLTFDVEFISDRHPHVEQPRPVRRGNRIVEDVMRYQQAGRWQGWIELNGQRWALDPATWWGARDHSWGIRGGLRSDESQPPLTVYPPMLFLWFVGQLPSRSFHLFQMDRGPADVIYLSGEETLPQAQRAEPGRHIKVANHDIEWQAGGVGQQFKQARLDLVLADGSRRELHIRPVGTRFFLKGGMYGGLNGWDHGDDKGRYYTEHNVWDLANPADRRVMRQFSDEICEFREGDEVGYGTFQYWVTGGYPRYPEPQQFPGP
ncbi:MAG: hypothetical protein ABI574_01170 [Burkholderiales bacterium]